MLAALVAICSLGYGCGYDGYENGKYYFSILTPQADYGIVVAEEEIYVDTIFEKVKK